MDIVMEEKQSEEVRDFLAKLDLETDPGVEFTLSLRENGKVCACGSLDGNVIKGIGVDPAMQGQGLSEQLMTYLRREAFSRGHRHLFVYTKPINEILFRGLGFFPIAATGKALLLESTRGGLRKYLESMEKHPGKNGAVVMNCSPFTLGHRYLIEQAREKCDWLYVFVLAEEKGMFRASDRLEMVKRGCADLDNVSVSSTEGYLISNATFPTYFLKDKAQGNKISCQMDIEIFSGQFAPALGITKRFVGTEPLDPVTCAYNQALQEQLPRRGIEVCEVVRREFDAAPISASRVRKAIEAGQWETVQQLTPQTTYEYLKTMIGG